MPVATAPLRARDSKAGHPARDVAASDPRACGLGTLHAEPGPPAKRSSVARGTGAEIPLASWKRPRRAARRRTDDRRPCASNDAEPQPARRRETESRTAPASVCDRRSPPRSRSNARRPRTRASLGSRFGRAHRQRTVECRSRRSLRGVASARRLALRRSLPQPRARRNHRFILQGTLLGGSRSGDRSPRCGASLGHDGTGPSVVLDEAQRPARVMLDGALLNRFVPSVRIAVVIAARILVEILEVRQ